MLAASHVSNLNMMTKVTAIVKDGGPGRSELGIFRWEESLQAVWLAAVAGWANRPLACAFEVSPERRAQW